MFQSPVIADVNTLLRQAPMTAAQFMRAAVRNIDEQFGDGYAAANPALVAAFIQASAADFNCAITLQTVQDSVAMIATRLSEIADCLDA